jgi:DNA-binding CsgD family transcriptional regulator
MLQAAAQFVKEVSDHTEPAELLDALQMVGRKHRQGLNVLCTFFLPAQYRLNRSIFFHADFPGEQFLDERQLLDVAHGGSPILNYAQTQAGPFTFTEAMRALRLTGNDRWPVEFIRKFGIRDCLSCPSRRWITAFYSEAVLHIDRVERHALAWAAGAAVEQIDKLVKKARYPGWPVELTPREIEALRLRAQGLKNPAAAERMGISANTVGTYLSRAIEKLGANDVTEAVAIAIRLGLLPGAG